MHIIILCKKKTLIIIKLNEFVATANVKYCNKSKKTADTTAIIASRYNSRTKTMQHICLKTKRNVETGNSYKYEMEQTTRKDCTNQTCKKKNKRQKKNTLHQQAERKLFILFC